MTWKSLVLGVVVSISTTVSSTVYAEEFDIDKEIEEMAKARQSSILFSLFPEDAQKEMMAIVQDIIEDSQNGPQSHVDEFNRRGPEAAMLSFSPRVQARIKNLADILSKRASFNNPENLERMKKAIPWNLLSSFGS